MRVAPTECVCVSCLVTWRANQISDQTYLLQGSRACGRREDSGDDDGDDFIATVYTVLTWQSLLTS